MSRSTKTLGGVDEEADLAPGALQLLVRWELPKEAHSILVEQEYTAERSAPKLERALQVVLERGDEKFLAVLLDHVDHRALTNGRYKPQTLATSTDVPRLYNPDRVRRRDLVQKNDAFKLFRVLRNAVIKHMKTHALPEDELEDVWWRHITRLMKTLVDGFHFDKSPEAFQKARMGAFGSGVPVAGAMARGGAPSPARQSWSKIGTWTQTNRRLRLRQSPPLPPASISRSRLRISSSGLSLPASRRWSRCCGVVLISHCAVLSLGSRRAVAFPKSASLRPWQEARQAFVGHD